VLAGLARPTAPTATATTPATAAPSTTLARSVLPLALGRRVEVLDGLTRMRRRFVVVIGLAVDADRLGAARLDAIAVEPGVELLIRQPRRPRQE
jgi:hypothetical protein